MKSKLRRNLDNVLTVLSNTPDLDILDSMKRLQLSYPKKELDILITILITDRYIISEHNWCVTPEGKRYNALDGYVKDRRNARLKTTWEIVKIGVSVIYAVVLAALSYLTWLKPC